jgi:hypothetical protein
MPHEFGWHIFTPVIPILESNDRIDRQMGNVKRQKCHCEGASPWQSMVEGRSVHQFE